MMKYVTRLLLTVVAVAAAVAMSAPPAVAEPVAPSSTTQSETSTTSPPDTTAPETTAPETTAPEATQPETTQPSTPAEATTTPPPSTSTTPKGGVGEVSVTAIDLKTALPVDGVSVALAVGDVSKTVTAPATATMPAGTVHAVVSAIPTGYNWAMPEPSSVELVPDGHVAITVKLSRPELRGAISITKRDRITGAPLAGARYRLSPCQGAVGAIIVTGEDGVGTQWIRHGCYHLKEIQAPAGYELDSTERTVTLIPTETLHLTLYDTPLAPVVIVRNPGNRVPLTSVPTGRTS